MDVSTTTKFFYLGGKKYTFTVHLASEVIRVNQTGETTINGEQVTLYSEGGAAITLVSSEPGNFTIDEADFGSAGIQGLTNMTFDIVTALSSGEVDTITVKNHSTALAGSGLIASDTDTDYSYGVSKAGTYVIRNSDADTLDIYTPGAPTAVYVAVGADPSFASGEGAAAGTVDKAVQIKNSVSKMESEIADKTALDRDVILIGGPCANSLVAEALEMSSSKPDCVSEFTALYPTEGVITVVNNVFTSGKKALVVAGVDRDATRALAVEVMQGTVEYSA
jgi:hypothetical protein